MKDLLGKAIAVNEKLVNWKLIDQEVVFLHEKEKVFYELNKSATYIWLNANGKKSVREIAKGLASKFPIGKEQAEKDTLDFVIEAVRNEIFVLA